MRIWSWTETGHTKWRVPRTLPPLYWSKIDCAPKVCIAEINHEKLRRAGECVRTSAHLGLIRWRKRDEKIAVRDWSSSSCSIQSNDRKCFRRFNHALKERSNPVPRRLPELFSSDCAKKCRLVGKWRSMLDVGSSFSMCNLTHAWALWEDQIRKPKLKKRMLGRVRRNLVNPSIPKMEVLDASF